LTEHPDRVKPKQLDAGDRYPRTNRRLKVWICTEAPRKHVEVYGWGLRPIQDCTFEGCKGIMVNHFAARENASTGSDEPVRKGNFGRLEPQAGWLCMENPDQHFRPDNG
jgi:hypothetical protein